MTSRIYNTHVGSRLVSGQEDIEYYNGNKLASIQVGHSGLDGLNKVLLYNTATQNLEYNNLPSLTRIPKVSSTYYRGVIESVVTTDWHIINPNFNVSITPQSVTSDILIHCNLYVSDATPYGWLPIMGLGQPGYGAFKLYRKIAGESNFTELTLANGSGTTGNTAVFMLNTLGSNQSDLHDKLNNVTGTFKDTTPLVGDTLKSITYTLYWRSALDGSTSYTIYLNRPELDTSDRHRAASSITATEILH